MLRAGDIPTRSRWLILLLLCLALLAPIPAVAQVLHWGHLQTSLELGYQLQRQTTSQNNAPDSNFDSDRFRERLHLRSKQMYLIDPRLVSINLGAGIEFFQENNDFAGQDASQDGRLYDYSIDSTFFSQKPYSLILFANQTENRVSRNFGTRTNITSNLKGARATMNEQSVLKNKGFPFFSTSLEVNQLKIEEDSEGNGQDFKRNEKHDVLQYTAHKGYLTADLSFYYRFEDIEDNLRQDNGFTTHTANLNYNLDFGPTLNWRWSSLNNFTSRSGKSGNDIFTANQNLGIHHNVDLFSNYHYTFNRFNTASGTTNSHIASISASQRIYRNLNTNLNAQGSLTDLPEGTTKSYSGGPGFSYQRHIFATGRLTLRANANYRINDNDLSSNTIDANNEPHQVGPDFPVGDPGFLLNNPFVDTASIVVVDRRDGSQLPATPGLDYEIIPEGDLTRLRPLPTSVVLRANDPLEVTYSHEVAPSIRFSTIRYDLGGTLDFGWLAFSASHSVSDQKFLSGTDSGLLLDRTFDSLGVRLHGDWRRVQLGADAGFQREDSTNQQYSTWRFSQFVSYPGFHKFTLTAQTVESFTTYDNPRSRNNQNYSATIELNGRIARAWQTRIYAGLLIFNDSEVENQTTARAGVNIRRDMGKLSLFADLLWNEFDRGFTNTTDRRINLRALRRF